MAAMVDTNFVPSTLQVDFEKNITKVYEAICSMDWDTAQAAAVQRPTEAKTWVVRHYDGETESLEAGQDIMWRFLPIHSACARQPPSGVISALIKAYPDCVKCVDDQGMYPLHYACGNQASREVVRQLLMAYPAAAKMRDPRGMLPIHYLTCWGPSSISVVDMVLVANRDVANVQDVDGNTPMDLALEGEYPERDAVIAALNRWLKGEAGAATSQQVQSLNKLPSTKVYPTSSRSSSRSNPQHFDQSSQSQKESKSAKLANFEGVLNEKDTEIMNLRRELAAANDERDGLRETLAQLTEEHDKFKMKSVILGDRLGSLNASLYGMMEQQNTVLDSLRAREDKWNTLTELRKEKMRELLELEEQDNTEEFNLKDSLLKQTKEMEAIQAVIAAVRTGN